MKFTLKDYQSDAVGDVLTNLRKARRYFHLEGDRTAFSLTATTGAGKTVMAAAVIEALFGGSDAYDFAPDPSAVVLWFSDDPSLNEQTRYRLLEASDRIGHSNLVVVQNTFNAEKFAPGKVYFLNRDKLGKNSLLVRGHEDEDGSARLPGMTPDIRPDLRSYTIWDTVSNTVEDSNLTLYLILDEAHRGMGPANEREKSTIVLRLINGHGDVPPIPVVWGISATVERFDQAMKGVEGRTTLSGVQVDSARVQESGLLKDDIVLDIPAEAGRFDTVLLKRATRKIIDSTEEWAKYAADQGEPEPVIPLLVLQTPNTPAPDTLRRALDLIFEEWSDLPIGSVAHVFGEHVTMQFGQWTVPYIAPERVQDSPHVRVLLAKDAISTGWDCPRAEVLVSFRPAQDKTHITQLLGRMVRTPLARRIPGNDRLNSVECLLPFFDRKTATSVAQTLMNTSEGEDGGGGGTGGGEGRRVLFDPVEMKPNEDLPEEVWDCFDALPSQSLPKRGAKPIRRLTALAQALADDGLLANAGKIAHSELHSVLDGLAVRHKNDVEAATSGVETVEGETVLGHLGGAVDYSAFSEAADDRVIADAYRAAERVLSGDVARTYAEHLAGAGSADNDDDALRDAHVRIAALALVPEIKQGLEDEADKLAVGWLTKYRVDIKNLSDERQALYNDLLAMSTEPQQIFLSRPKVRQEDTKERDKEGNEKALPTRPKHLLCAEDGTFPVGTLGSTWELDVLDAELARTGTVAWYRNPARAAQESLGVSYRDGKQAWKTMRPDFIFFSQNAAGEVRGSIVDPHGHHLGDALPKLRGLANFAAQFEGEFHRVEAVAKVKDTLRVLDMTKETVRKAVAEATDAEALYVGPQASDY